MRVGLIEKDRMVIQLVQQYLAEAGHIVMELQPTIESILQANCDLLVLDLNQQTEGKKKLYDEVRADSKLAQLPCIMIAGRITAQDIQASRSDPLTSFLVKPFTKSVFDDGLKRCLRQSLLKNGLGPVLTEGPKASTPSDTLIRWRHEMDQIVQYQQRVKSQLMLHPKDIFEVRLKEWMNENPGQKPDTKAIKRAAMELALLKSVVIVDHDEANQNLMQEYARNQSILEVESFAGGEEAWRHLKRKSPDFIIMDWSHDEAGGLCLYNRLRSGLATRQTPVVVLIKNSDEGIIQSLYEEDLHLNALEKPVQPKKLQETIMQLMTRSLSSQKVGQALDQVFRQIVSIKLLKELVDDLSESMPDMKLHMVDMVNKLMKEQRFEEAEHLAKILIEKPDFAVAASTVLARIYHMTRRTQEARDLLRYVCTLAPQRLDRLLLAAETEFSTLNLDKARTYLAQARRIDGEDPKVKALSYISEKIDEHSEWQNTPVKNLVSVLNTVGITLAKSGKPEEAVRYYTSALMIDADRFDQARLYYNLGLSYERIHDLEKALAAHQEADRLAAGKSAKIQSHLESLRERLRSPGKTRNSA